MNKQNNFDLDLRNVENNGSAGSLSIGTSVPCEVATVTIGLTKANKCKSVAPHNWNDFCML
ncbi:hypothetical protein ACQRBN_00115 [Bariatricus sp. SGI.154]|uniref:hypothetical protein n=1 Tax=Bariatricus sp. SGI.154 TaxID=3420549 RepID=UPI003D07996B